MIAYLIKSTVCLLLLLLVYHAFLERDKMHWFNRWFLLFGLVFSLTVPLLTFNIGAPAQLSDQINAINSRLATESPASTEYVPKSTIEGNTPQAASDSSVNSMHLLIGLYILISSVVAVRLFRNLYALWSKIRNNPHAAWQTATLVLIDEDSPPHSFFHFIFVDKHLHQFGQINEAVLTHELTHSRQKHSVDILFIELLKVAFWFNPVLWFYKRAMQLNHEFLADEAVVADSGDVQRYQKLLLKMQSGDPKLQLVSSIKYSITKKRIIMMTKNSTRWRTTGKKLALIPVLAGLIFAFSTQTTSAQDVQQMSISELIEAVSKRMDNVDSLTDVQQKQLRSLILKMQKKLQPQAPPPPPPMDEVENPKEALNMVTKSFQEHTRFYLDIPATEANKPKLAESYEKVMTLYRKMNELQKRINDNPPPPPPLPISPAKRINASAKKSTADTANQIQRERELLLLKSRLESLKMLYEKYADQYMKIKPTQDNKEEMEAAYQKLLQTNREIDEVTDKIHNTDFPAPPMSISPKKRLEKKTKISADSSADE